MNLKIIEISKKELNDTNKKIEINYTFNISLFGNILIASTNKGVCYIKYLNKNYNQNYEQLELKKEFPHSVFLNKIDSNQKSSIEILNNNNNNNKDTTINLHLKSTPFQIKIYKELFKIPYGKLTTYKNIAIKIQAPKAYRAVGTAIGKNLIAYLIPCHRVVQISGKLGGYRWGIERKQKIIDLESKNVDI